MNAPLEDPPTTSLGRYFSESLCAVLAVSGKQRANGFPGPIRPTNIQRKTGVARSTLRALKSDAANPDLVTIDRVAKGLGIPPAFLLMRPQDWHILGQAFAGSGDFLVAATKLLNNDQLDHGNPIEKILRECKVHPDLRPKGIGASPEVERVNARDEWRRRYSLKLNSLMLRKVYATESRVALAAIAGAMVSRCTPHTPNLED